MNERSSLKHSFLKEVIFRMDFDNILEEDVQTFVKNLRDKYFKMGYTTQSERYENKADIQVRSNLIGESGNPFEFGRVEHSKVCQFLNNTVNSVDRLELSKRFFILTVNVKSKYKSFDKYLDCILASIDSIQQSSPFFKPVRIGLRKINICLIPTLPTINKYFRQPVFNANDVSNALNDYKYLASNSNVLLRHDNFKINYIWNIQSGLVQKEGEQTPMYQLVLDIDAFSDDAIILKEYIKGGETTKRLILQSNDILFDLYKRSLTDTFFEALKQDTFRNEEIQGVV
jgi:uncharacterized protein (TIGR04255 family)